MHQSCCQLYPAPRPRRRQGVLSHLPWGDICYSLKRALWHHRQHGSDDSLPSVAPDPCTACGDCVEVCPQDLFVLVPESQKLFVQCNSPLTGEAALSGCRVACDACGRCAADAPADSVEMVAGLPVVHYDRAEQPTPNATWRCPTGAIAWLEGKQFLEPEEESSPPRRAYG